MKSRFSGASRMTSSTSLKTRGKLSLLQLPGTSHQSKSQTGERPAKEGKATHERDR